MSWLTARGYGVPLSLASSPRRQAPPPLTLMLPPAVATPYESHDETHQHTIREASAMVRSVRCVTTFARRCTIQKALATAIVMR